jgi:D-glycero-alpha-D-manno-heptose-7-phosphate kinase
LSIWTRAPARIDLAGGTLDIWPLYLFMDYGVTVNVAVNLSSQAWVIPGPGDGYRLVSEDAHVEETAVSLDGLDLHGPLGLVARAVRHFRPEPGLTVVTYNDAPRGSGLGSSSSLLLAVLAGLEKLAGQAPDTSELVNLAADLEAQTIRVPTGKQDYYAAIHGGANAIWFEPGRNRVEELPLTAEFTGRLRDVIILSFTGQARLSAPTNWEMVRNFVDGRPEACERLQRVRETALRVREAWLAQDLEELGHLVAREWENRRELAAGVCTPAVEKAMAVAARAGALGSKICGAGGGGCMVTVAREGRKEEVVAALKAEGIEVLDFDFDKEGLLVRAS